MFFALPKKLLQSYGTIALLSLLLALYVESLAVSPVLLVSIAPLLVILVLYQLVSLLNADQHVRKIFASSRAKAACLFFLLYLVICFSPVNELAKYIRGSHAFHDYRGYWYRWQALLARLRLLSMRFKTLVDNVMH